MGSIRRTWRAVGHAITAHPRFVTALVLTAIATGAVFTARWVARRSAAETARAPDETPERDVAIGSSASLATSVPLDAASAAHRAKAIRTEYRFYARAMGNSGLLRRIRRVREWRDLVDRHATAAGVDPVRIEAIMAVESKGDSDAESVAGARGLLQVIDVNARQYGAPCGVRNPMVDSYHPGKSICTGTRYFAELLARYGGDAETAYAGYNWGQTLLDRAFACLKGRYPDRLRSFWSLWDAVDPQFTCAVFRHRRAVKVRRNPQGLLLFNYGRDSHETRAYVPRVLAWEYILRYYDAHGRVPPLDADPVGEPLNAVPSVPDRQAEPGVGVASGVPADTIVIVVAQPAARPPPTSSVWYTAQDGDTIGSVIAFLGANPRGVAALNPDLARSGWHLRAGARVLVPEPAFAFASGNGRETYRDIAQRHRMTTGELLRWSGRWSDADAWAFARSATECGAAGCPDEVEVAARGMRFLVRRF